MLLRDNQCHNDGTCKKHLRKEVCIMTKEEFNSLSNQERVDLLNKYVGKTTNFKEDNQFSWSYATSNTSFVKDGSLYISTSENTKDQKSETEKKAMFLFNRRTDTTEKHLRVVIDDTYADMLELEQAETGMSKTEIVNYALYKYYEDDK